MAKVKKTKGKLIAWILVIVIAISGIVGAIAVTSARKDKKDVSIHTVGTSSITQTVSSTGDVTSGLVREYKPATVATVKEVFVKVGDTVKKGEKIATFDTSQIDTQVASLEASYKSSKASYEAAVKNQADAAAKLKSINKQIAAAEKKLAATSTAKTTTAKATTKKATTQASTKATQINNIENTQKVAAESPLGDIIDVDIMPNTTSRAGQGTGVDSIIDSLNDVSEQLQTLVDTVSSLTKNIEQTNALLTIIMDTVAEEIEKGTFDSDVIADKVGDAVYDAMHKGMVEFVDSGAAVAMIETAVKNVDWSAIGSSIATSDNVSSSTAQLELAALYAQKEVYEIVSSNSTVDSQKQIMNATKNALDVLKASQAELQEGWTADFNGTITTCDIVSGGSTNALQTAITLENMDQRVVTISLNEYDVHKVKVGMEATVKTAYGEYSGKLESIAPTATGGSSSSMLDNVGSMAGISGLSSLTSSGAGVECKIVVDEPDENIIVGFTADVTITTGSFNDVPSVPIESIVLEKEGTYVYVYDEEEQTVTKTKIETGATSDTSYQVTSGLSVGQKIVATPATDYEDETFKVRVVDKTNIK